MVFQREESVLSKPRTLNESEHAWLFILEKSGRPYCQKYMVGKEKSREMRPEKHYNSDPKTLC